MKKLPFAVFFIILVVGAYFVVSLMRESTTQHASTQSTSPSNQTVTPKSPYSRVFNSILSMSTYKNNAYSNSLLYGKEYLWPGLERNATYRCNLTNNISYMMKFINRAMREFINASEESVKSGNTVEALLLGDMMNTLTIPMIETAIISKGWANYSGEIRLESVQGAYRTACVVNARLENIKTYDGMALKKYGEPPFNLSSLEELNDRIRPYLSYTPMNGTQMINWRAALENIVYVLTYNKSLLNRFSANYTPQKAAALLANLTKRVDGNAYLKSVFKPALVYLTILRDSTIEYDALRGKNEPVIETDLFYLKVFYAWYNIVKPYTLWR